MTRHKSMAASAALFASMFFGLHAKADAQLLGTSDNFSVLAGTTVTNTGPTVLWGDVGVWQGTAITGFSTDLLTNDAIHVNDAVAMQAQADLAAAYDLIAGESMTQDLTGQDLGGLTLFAGVYHFSSSAFLTGTLILDAQGDPNARFDFQIGSTLITASNSSVVFLDGRDSRNVFWQVGSFATLGSDTAFAGHVLAMTSITANNGATVADGSLLARNGAVTLDSNRITAFVEPVPEPATWAILGSALGIHAIRRRRKSMLKAKSA